jgi:5S rRNA maturation endonuclease (ribonuclease M5)
MRVSKQQPCPVCHKDNWCLIGDDGLDALCMRVQSDRPLEMKSGEAGYIHRLGGERKVFRPIARKVEPPKPTVDFSSAMLLAISKTPKARLAEFSESLGLPPEVLEYGTGVGCAWLSEHSAWGFPMLDGNYKTIGVRLRNSRGEKWAIKGSKSGIFYSMRDVQQTLYVCEGPTDTAAALACGMFAVGRPSCSAGAGEIADFINRNRAIRRVIIISDNDSAGLRGAKSLAEKLPLKSCTVTLPFKDMREFYRIGGTSAFIDDLVKDMVWTNPL